MESDERYIESCFGKKAPFTVPEGYFDNLTQNIMNSVEAADKVVPHVPEPTQHNKVITINWWHRCRRYAAVAACVAFIVGGVSVGNLSLLQIQARHILQQQHITAHMMLRHTIV